jgi:hypothetical protein
MFEGGAVWATKQKEIIALVYNNYDKFVPDYLKSMKKIKVDFSNPKMNRDLYISIVNLLNSLIDYLNRNFSEEANKKQPIKEVFIPNDVELITNNKTIDEFYNKDVIKYWTYYVLKNNI